MTINDVLRLKAARRDAIANLKCFWGLEHQIPNFDGYIYIQYVAPPYSARISAMYFLPFFNVWLGSVSGSTMKNSRRVGENSDLILSRLWTKVHENFRRCRKPLVVSKRPFRLSVSCFIQQIFATKCRSRRKTQQMQKFLAPNFVGGTAPTSVRQFVRATDYPLLGKVWLSSVC